MYFDDFSTRLKKEGVPRLALFFGDSDGVIAQGYRRIKENFQKGSPGGAIQVFDGTSEGLGGATHLFGTEDRAHKIFSKKSTAVRQVVTFSLNPQPSRGEHGPANMPSKQPDAGTKNRRRRRRQQQFLLRG